MKKNNLSQETSINLPYICKIASRIFAAVLMLVTLPSLAGHNKNESWQDTNWSKQHVVVFSDCGYNGLSKSIPIGDYPRLGEIGLRPNEISSLVVPDGLAIEIFQGRGFNGHWYRVNQNQVCLKGNWNDRIGSMRVVEDNPNNSFGFSDAYESDPDQPGKNCHPFTVYAGGSDGGIRFVDEEDPITPVQAGRKVEGNLCRKGVVRVELAKRDRGGDVLLEIAGREYAFEPWSQYDDFRNRWYRRYVSVDLPKLNKKRNQIDYGGNGWGNTPGFGKRYSSGVDDGASWGNNYPRNWNRHVARNTSNSNNQSTYSGTTPPYNGTTPPDSGITPPDNSNKNCTPYSVSGNHKDIGVRFYAGDNQFHQTGSGTTNLQLCHSGSIKFEIAKMKESAAVEVRIAGRVYQFRAGERGDRFANNWYRKYFRINLQ